MSRQIQERLSLAGSAIAIVAFALSYGKAVEPLAALGVAGLAYLVFASGALIYLVTSDELDSDARGPSGVFSAKTELVLSIPLIWLLIGLNEVIAGWSLDALLLLMFGVVAVLLCPLLLYFAIAGYRERHKICPECGNEVLAVARVCHYCAYRWQPALPAGFHDGDSVDID